MKNKYLYLTLLVSGSQIALPTNSLAQNKTNKRRNILVILCDQLRPDMLNPYGCTAMKTKGINSLAKMGIVFDNAITASPVSAPARASMMTGRFPSSHGVWSNDLPFNEGLEFLPERMNKNGYISAAFGKLHHYPAKDAKGFKIFIPMEESRLELEEPYVQYLRGKYPKLNVQKFRHFSTNTGFSKPKNEHYDYWNTSNAIHFLDEYEQKNVGEQPFFMWLSLQGPHTPYDPPKDLSGDVDVSKLPKVVHVDTANFPTTMKLRSAFDKDKDELQKIRLAYARKTLFEDEQVQRILAALKEKDLLENTTIIFSADHGDQLGDHELKEKGPYPYPFHQNVPLILANDPRISAGKRSDLLVSNIDLASTCLDIAGDDQPLGLSRSLFSMLENKKMQRKFNFSEFADSYKMVEDKRYRFAYFPFDNRMMLFDKVKDPDYKHNLADNSKFDKIKLAFMMKVMDFQIINKSVHIESQDLGSKVQKGIEEIHPNWMNDHFIINFPLPYHKWKYLKDHGYEFHYNDFCIPRKINRAYGTFWTDKRYVSEK